MDPFIYRIFNRDLENHSDEELWKHYDLFGKHENRICNNSAFKNIYPDFDLKIYKLYYDLKDKTDFELLTHFHYLGYNENRYYNINTLNLSYESNKNKYLEIYSDNFYKSIYEFERDIPIYYLNLLEKFNNNRIKKLNFNFMEKNISKKLFNKYVFHDGLEYFEYVSLYNKYILVDIIINKVFTFKCLKTNNIYKTKKCFNIEYSNINYIIYVFDEIYNPFFVICGGGIGWMFFLANILFIHYFKINQLYIIFNTCNEHLLGKEKKELIDDILKYYKNNIINNSLETITFFGFMQNIGHEYWNELSLFKFYIDLDLLKQIDNIIIGPYDYYNIYDYCIKNNIKVSKEINLNKINNNLIFKFVDYFMMEDLKEFVLENNKYINDSEIKYINYIKQNHYPIVTINLRGLYRYLYNQSYAISNIINSLLIIYPKIFIIFDGYVKNKNNINNYLDETLNNKSLDKMEESYISIFKNIVKDLKTNNYISLISSSIERQIEWLKISDYGLMQLGAGAFNHTWLMNKKALFIGRNTILNEETLMHTYHDFIFREKKDFTTYINPSMIDFNKYNHIDSSFYLDWKIILYHMIKD